MLLDLPPELIDLIVGYLDRPFAVHRCSCFLQDDPDRQLALYDQYKMAHETDALHFGMAYPFILQCIANGGWRGAIDAMCFRRGNDIRVIPYVPEGFRGMVRCVIFPSWHAPLTLSPLTSRRKPCRKIKASPSASSFWNFTEDNLKDRGIETTSQLTTLPAILRQFSAPLSLDIDVPDELRYDYRNIDRLFGAGSTDVDRSPLPAKELSIESPCPVTELVVRSTHHISRLPDLLPLPLLTRLHVSAAFEIRWNLRMEVAGGYRNLFHFETVATIWRSLKNVQVCVRVSLPWRPEHLNIWNHWVS
jgi:hypothetical protein